MINVSSSLKQACNSDNLIYREYVVLKGTTTQIDVATEMYATAYKDTHFIGTFNMKYIKFTTSNDVQYRNKELTFYKEVNGESFKVGNFIVTEIVDNDSEEEVTVTAYDYGLKFANPYVSNLDYSSGTITMKNVLDEICEKLEVELENETIVNENFIVDSNQFVSGEMYGDVISAIAFMSADFAFINNEDKLQFTFNTPTDEVIEDYVDLDDKRDTRPITSVSLGMTDIEGENVVLKDEELIEQYGEHWLVINDVPFAYTQEKRTQLITAIFEKVKGFGYSSFKSEYSFKPYMQLGDLIQFRNKEGELINSIVLKITSKYDEITLEAPSVTDATVEYEQPLSAIDIAKRTEVLVNKQEGYIELISQKTETMQEDLQENFYDKEDIQQLIISSEEGLKNSFSTAGGNNLLRNSQPYFGSGETWDYWEGEVKRINDIESSTGYAFSLQNGIVKQSVDVENTYCSVSFKYKRLIELSECKVRINENEILLEENGEIKTSFLVENRNILFEMECDTNDGYEIYDIMINYGDNAYLPYMQNQNEIKTTNVSISENIKIESSVSNTITTLGTEGLIGKNKSSDEIVFKQTEDGIQTKNINSESGTIGNLLIMQIEDQTWLTGL